MKCHIEQSVAKSYILKQIAKKIKKLFCKFIPWEKYSLPWFLWARIRKYQNYIFTAIFYEILKKFYNKILATATAVEKAALSANASLIEDIFQILYECLSRPFACHFCLSHFHLPHLPFVGIFNYWGPCVFVRRVPSLCENAFSLALHLQKGSSSAPSCLGRRAPFNFGRTHALLFPWWMDICAHTFVLAARELYMRECIFCPDPSIIPSLLGRWHRRRRAEPGEREKRERGSTFSSLCSEG